MEEENWCRIHKQEHNNCIYFTQKRPNVNTVFIFKVICSECNEDVCLTDKEMDTKIETLCYSCYHKLLDEEVYHG